METIDASCCLQELDCTCPAGTMACTAAEATCASSGPGAEVSPGESHEAPRGAAIAGRPPMGGMVRPLYRCCCRQI